MESSVLYGASAPLFLRTPNRAYLPTFTGEENYLLGLQIIRCNTNSLQLQAAAAPGCVTFAWGWKARSPRRNGHSRQDDRTGGTSCPWGKSGHRSQESRLPGPIRLLPCRHTCRSGYTRHSPHRRLSADTSTCSAWHP